MGVVYHVHHHIQQIDNQNKNKIKNIITSESHSTNLFRTWFPIDKLATIKLKRRRPNIWRVHLTVDLKFHEQPKVGIQHGK